MRNRRTPSLGDVQSVYCRRVENVGAGVLDRKGRPVHDGGVTASPGLYLIGLPFLRRRKSTLIDGAASDARELVAHLVTHLDTLAHRRAS